MDRAPFGLPAGLPAWPGFHFHSSRKWAGKPLGCSPAVLSVIVTLISAALGWAVSRFSSKFPMQAVVVSTFRLAGFRCSKLLRLVIGATSYLLKVSVRP